MSIAILKKLKSLDYTGNPRDVVELVKEVLDGQQSNEYTHTIHNSVVLVGGGSGVPVVGRSLGLCAIKSITMIANPTDALRNKKTRELAGAGIFKDWGAPDLVDITKQLLHSVPQGEWDELRRLCDKKPQPMMRIGYFVLEALRQLIGLQGAINMLGNWLGNSYTVIPSAESSTEAFYVKDGRVMNVYDFALGGYSLPEEIVLQPQAVLSGHAKEAIKGSEFLVFGPGDVHFSVLPHFQIKGFSKEAEKSAAAIILIANLTARPIDIPGFSLSRFLDLYGRYLPDREIIVLVNCGDSVKNDPLIDDVSGDYYGRFRLARADLASRQKSNNDQLIHDEEKLGRALAAIIEP